MKSDSKGPLDLSAVSYRRNLKAATNTVQTPIAARPVSAQLSSVRQSLEALRNTISAAKQQSGAASHRDTSLGAFPNFPPLNTDRSRLPFLTSPSALPTATVAGSAVALLDRQGRYSAPSQRPLMTLDEFFGSTSSPAPAHAAGPVIQIPSTQSHPPHSFSEPSPPPATSTASSVSTTLAGEVAMLHAAVAALYARSATAVPSPPQTVAFANSIASAAAAASSAVSPWHAFVSSPHSIPPPPGGFLGNTLPNPPQHAALANIVPETSIIGVCRGNCEASAAWRTRAEAAEDEIGILRSTIVRLQQEAESMRNHAAANLTYQTAPATALGVPQQLEASGSNFLSFQGPPSQPSSSMHLAHHPTTPAQDALARIVGAAQGTVSLNQFTNSNDVAKAPAHAFELSSLTNTQLTNGSVLPPRGSVDSATAGPLDALARITAVANRSRAAAHAVTGASLPTATAPTSLAGGSPRMSLAPSVGDAAPSGAGAGGGLRAFNIPSAASTLDMQAPPADVLQQFASAPNPREDLVFADAHTSIKSATAVGTQGGLVDSPPVDGSSLGPALAAIPPSMSAVATERGSAEVAPSLIPHTLSDAQQPQQSASAPAAEHTPPRDLNALPASLVEKLSGAGDGFTPAADGSVGSTNPLPAQLQTNLPSGTHSDSDPQALPPRPPSQPKQVQAPQPAPQVQIPPPAAPPALVSGPSIRSADGVVIVAEDVQLFLPTVLLRIRIDAPSDSATIPDLEHSVLIVKRPRAARPSPCRPSSVTSDDAAATATSRFYHISFEAPDDCTLRGLSVGSGFPKMRLRSEGHEDSLSDDAQPQPGRSGGAPQALAASDSGGSQRGGGYRQRLMSLKRRNMQQRMATMSESSGDDLEKMLG